MASFLRYVGLYFSNSVRGCTETCMIVEYRRVWKKPVVVYFKAPLTLESSVVPGTPVACTASTLWHLVAVQSWYRQFHTAASEPPTAAASVCARRLRVPCCCVYLARGVQTVQKCWQNASRDLFHSEHRFSRQ
jgi:hypothetical protein